MLNASYKFQIDRTLASTHTIFNYVNMSDMDWGRAWNKTLMSIDK
jgi:hypothetical protein